MWQYTTERDRCADECIQLFITTYRKLKVTWRDTLDFEVLRCVTSKLENFGREVFEDGGDIDCSFGSDAHLVLGLGLEEALYSTAWELVSHVSACDVVHFDHVRSRDAQSHIGAQRYGVNWLAMRSKSWNVVCDALGPAMFADSKSHLMKICSYLQAGLRRVRFLRLACIVRARLSSSLATCLACNVLEMGALSSCLRQVLPFPPAIADICGSPQEVNIDVSSAEYRVFGRLVVVEVDGVVGMESCRMRRCFVDWAAAFSACGSEQIWR